MSKELTAEEFDKQTDLEIEHIFDSGVNEIRIKEMVERRCKAYHKAKVESITDEIINEKRYLSKHGQAFIKGAKWLKQKLLQ